VREDAHYARLRQAAIERHEEYQNLNAYWKNTNEFVECMEKDVKRMDAVATAVALEVKSILSFLNGDGIKVVMCRQSTTRFAIEAGSYTR
jgi:hypothetical protein